MASYHTCKLPPPAIAWYRMDVRIRLPELMKAAAIDNAHALSKASGGRISMTTAYRLVAAGGKVRYLDSNLLDVLCDVFGVSDLNVLLEREQKKRAA